MKTLGPIQEPGTIKVVKLGENDFRLTFAMESKMPGFVETHTWRLTKAKLVELLKGLQKEFGTLEIVSGNEYLQ